MNGAPRSAGQGAIRAALGFAGVVLTAVLLAGCAGGGSTDGRKFTAVSAGDRHTCAIDDAGATWCWGENRFGQLGDGSTTGSTSPVEVAGGNRFVQVDAGNTHTCAVDDAGAAWCWGGNFVGKIGDGTKESRSTPVRVQGLPGPVAFVAVTSERSCAAVVDGGAWCWGDNTQDVFGVSGGGIFLTATEVLAKPVRSIAMSPGRGCYAADEILCAGIDVDGQSPDGFTGTAIGGLPADVEDLVVAQFLICSRSAGGRVHCWGNMSWFVDKDGNSTESFWTRVSEIPDADARAITAMESTVCYTRGDGRVECRGQRPGATWLLGGGGFTTPPAMTTEGLGGAWPLPLPGDRIVVIDGGMAHICGINDSGELWCVGRNAEGQLGDGTLTERPEPVRVR